MLEMSIDTKGVQAKLEQLVKALPGAKSAAENSVATEVLRLSGLEVPHQYGDLQNSGAVLKVGSLTIVGYFKAYAARLHEHPEYQFREGRKGKYLEDPINKNIEPLNQTFGIAFQQELF